MTVIRYDFIYHVFTCYGARSCYTLCYVLSRHLLSTYPHLLLMIKDNAYLSLIYLVIDTLITTWRVQLSFCPVSLGCSIFHFVSLSSQIVPLDKHPFPSKPSLISILKRNTYIQCYRGWTSIESLCALAGPSAPTLHKGGRSL